MDAFKVAKDWETPFGCGVNSSFTKNKVDKKAVPNKADTMKKA